MLSHIYFDILENSKTALADTLQTSIIDSMLHDENKDWDLQHSVSFSPEEIQMVFILFIIQYINWRENRPLKMTSSIICW